MEISKIELFAVQAPIHEPYQSAHGKHETLDCTMVRIQTREGITGLGEVFHSNPGYSYETIGTIRDCIERCYGPVLLRRDCSALESLMAAMEGARTGHPFAKSVLEMAVLDALGKTAGLSTSKLLGGPYSKEVALCAGIGVRPVEAMVAKAVALAEAGFDTIKIKIGGVDMDEDVARVREVRAALGPRIALRVDANASYSLPEALRLAARLEQYDLEHLEQPLPNWDFRGMAVLAADASVPIMADESVTCSQDVVRIASERAADLVKIKISKVGGFLHARKVLAVAEAVGLPVVVGQGLGTSLLATAEIHLAASSPIAVRAGEMNGPLKLVKDPVKTPIKPEKGRIQVPTEPGLGVELDPELIEQFTRPDSYRCLER